MSSSVKNSRRIIELTADRTAFMMKIPDGFYALAKPDFKSTADSIHMSDVNRNHITRIIDASTSLIDNGQQDLLNNFYAGWALENGIVTKKIGERFRFIFNEKTGREEKINLPAGLPKHYDDLSLRERTQWSEFLVYSIPTREMDVIACSALSDSILKVVRAIGSSNLPGYVDNAKRELLISTLELGMRLLPDIDDSEAHKFCQTSYGTRERMCALEIDTIFMPLLVDINKF